MIEFSYQGQPQTLTAGRPWRGQTRDDTYRDTSASELWKLVRTVQAGVPWREAVRMQYGTTSPWLFRIVTAPSRNLFLKQYPVPAGICILDVGAGWGQYSLPLAQQNTVVSVEPTPERLAFIHAAAEQDGVVDRIHFIEADFLDLTFARRFDLACCIGVLEWVPKFRPGDPWSLQCEFLRRIRDSLRPGGRLLLGIENRMGLKYMLGAPDDHCGYPDISVYDSDLARQKYHTRTAQELRCFTYTDAELRELLQAAGFSSPSFFAAFPDYKLPEKILPFDDAVENALMEGAPFADEHDGSCGARLENQRELRSHYRSLAQMGIARHFAPSFFVTASA